MSHINTPEELPESMRGIDLNEFSALKQDMGAPEQVPAMFVITSATLGPVYVMDKNTQVLSPQRAIALGFDGYDPGQVDQDTLPPYHLTLLMHDPNEIVPEIIAALLHLSLSAAGIHKVMSMMQFIIKQEVGNGVTCQFDVELAEAGLDKIEQAWADQSAKENEEKEENGENAARD